VLSQDINASIDVKRWTVIRLISEPVVEVYSSLAIEMDRLNENRMRKYYVV